MISNKNKEIVLASSSPRRKQMLTASGISFKISAANIIENPHENETGHQYVKRNSQEKAIAVNKLFSNGEIILSADTIVVTKTDKILEKPINAEHAKSMLQMLSGNTHLVLSGYSFYQNNIEIINRIVETSVTFRKISTREIEAYIKTGEPFDKSGSYGIQGRAMGFIESIKGSYTNVMGLPLSQVLLDLEEFFGIETFTTFEEF